MAEDQPKGPIRNKGSGNKGPLIMQNIPVKHSDRPAKRNPEVVTFCMVFRAHQSSNLEVDITLQRQAGMTYSAS